jgi:hypothetical protein
MRCAIALIGVLAASASGCCDQKCIKRALVLEAEGGPQALDFASAHCCSACSEGAVKLPGRCLEVNSGLKEEHRNVDIWDCDPDEWSWQTWRWVGAGKTARALNNTETGRCLHVYSYAPPARLEQSSNCDTLWEHTASNELVDSSTGLCLIVNDTVSDALTSNHERERAQESC